MGKLFLFMAFPALELYVMVQAGKYIGGLGVVALVFASMMFGGWLIFRRGVRKLTDARDELRSGRTLPQDLLGGMLVLLAGLLFIFPGFISDAMGLLLLLPPFRALCGEKFLQYGAQRQREGRSGFQGTFVFHSGGNPFSQGSRRDTCQDAPHETVIDCEVEPEPAAKCGSETRSRIENDKDTPGSRE